MKTQRINLATFILFCSICLVSSCSKDSLVTEVMPDKQALYSHAIDQTNILDESYATHDPGVRCPDGTQINTSVHMIVKRGRANEQLEDAISPEESSSAKKSLGETVDWAFSIVGTTKVDHEDFGVVSVLFNLQTDPNTGTLSGSFKLRSVNDMTSSMTFRISGTDDIERMMDNSSLPFTFRLTSSSGIYRDAPTYGDGAIRTDAEGHIDFYRVIKTQLKINFCNGWDQN